MRLITFFLLCFGLLSADERVSSIVVLPASSVVDQDYFTWGKTVEVSGLVGGDLYVMGGEVLIQGHIKGDVLAAGGNILITGTVDGNVRALGGQVLIGGTVGKNVTVLSGSAQFLSSATIGGNVVSGSGSLEMSSKVGQNVTVWVGGMRITSLASIGQDLDYTSASEAFIEGGAKIGGKVNHHISKIRRYFDEHWIRSFLLGSQIIAFLMNFFYSFAIAWILMRAFPDFLHTALWNLRHKPLKSFALGLTVLVALPLVCLLLLMTVIGIPFALTLIALNIVTFYTSKVIGVIWASNHLLKKIRLKPNHLGTLSLGLFCYLLLTAIPFVGPVLSFFAMVMGLGSTLIVKKS